MLFDCRKSKICRTAYKVNVNACTITIEKGNLIYFYAFYERRPGLAGFMRKICNTAASRTGCCSCF